MLDREHLGLHGHAVRAQRVRPPDPLVRGGPRDPRHRRRAGARRVHPRARGWPSTATAVEILAEVDGHPVAARQDNMLVISFHPEIAGETRVHELFLRTSGDRLLHPPRRVGRQRRRPRACEREPEDGDRLSERGWEQARGLGERLRGEGIEAIVASPFRPRAGDRAGDRRRARPAGTRPTSDLHEVPPVRRLPRRRRRDYEGTGHISWMPDAPPDARRAGRRVVRGDRRPRRARAGAPGGADRGERVLCVSHWGFLHFFLGAAIFRERVLARSTCRRSTACRTSTPASRSSRSAATT